MYVCLCKGVSDRAVRTCIRSGASTVHQVGLACGAGTDCGSCRGMIRELIDEHEEEAPSSRVSLPLLSHALAPEAAGDRGRALLAPADRCVTRGLLPRASEGSRGGPGPGSGQNWARKRGSFS